MSENDTNEELLEIAETEPLTDEIALEEFELNPLSSAEFIKTETDEIKAPQFLIEEEPIAAETQIETEEEVDPIFAELAAPKLPELARENRARLQMQSPTVASITSLGIHLTSRPSSQCLKWSRLCSMGAYS